MREGRKNTLCGANIHAKLPGLDYLAGLADCGAKDVLFSFKKQISIF